MEAAPITKKLIAFGNKKVYLPKFTVALVRSKDHSPYQARFRVPLDFSKFDLRDYLYHAYNVKSFNIRTHVRGIPVRDTREQPRHWFRPDSEKYMTVQLERPFVWPEEPKDLEPWGAEEKEKNVEETVLSSGGNEKKAKRNAARALREQALSVLNRGKKAEKVEEVEEGNAVEEKVVEKVKNKSREQYWEERRTEKWVQGDETEKFRIKA